VPVSVGQARRLAREWSQQHGAASTQLDDIALAVTEAVANIVRHAYPGTEPGLIHLDAHREAGALVFSIRDDGTGPNPPSPNPGLGAGLPILAEVSDHTTIKSTSAGTHLTLRFRLA
jgi:serine/threonine-protein kinase RsbW